MIDAKNLVKELSSCPEGGIVLIETDASKIWDVHLAAVKWLSGKGYAQIVLSVSRSCKNLLKLYKENGIDTGKMIIVCTLCQEKEIGEQASNVIHVSGGSSLTEISLSLSECMKTVMGPKFIFIDSINTMLIHNEPNTLARFIHMILTKMRANNVSGLLISLESETNKEVRAEIAQLCDKVIRV